MRYGGEGASGHPDGVWRSVPRFFVRLTDTLVCGLDVGTGLVVCVAAPRVFAREELRAGGGDYISATLPTSGAAVCRSVMCYAIYS